MCFCVDLIVGWRGKKKRGGGGCGREGKLDSHQLIEMYQPAGQQPQNCGALPDLWLRENTTARGNRGAEKGLFALKLAGQLCFVAVRMDIIVRLLSLYLI